MHWNYPSNMADDDAHRAHCLFTYRLLKEIASELETLNQINPPKCTLKPLLFARTHRLFPAHGADTF
ncbi:MAG: hypothetical protein GY820_09990 [Gammaproteobacteria bacterium]|nr:hypothetical protein [Gammaproteobacteria bacterium]